MFFDFLAVIVVSLLSALFLSTTAGHGLPSSAASAFHYLRSPASARSPASLRLFHRRPMPSMDNDIAGDASEMFVGESTEDDESTLSLTPFSPDPLEFDWQPFSRKLLVSKKRSTPPFNLKSAVDQLAQSSSSSSADLHSVDDINQLKESMRLSPSLTSLVEKSPVARIWLKLLLQKLMQEQQPAPYIFKYGRRRK